MSQYPPPPPSYGAYDQPPPPGFGYPPGNQGPYYPQPGYPQPPYQPGVNPTTCPPGPGGYYPGQPATQTIHKTEKSYSGEKEKDLFREKNKLTLETEKPKYSQRFPILHTGKGKSFTTELEDEYYKSIIPESDDAKNKPFSKDFEGKCQSTVLKKPDEMHDNSMIKSSNDKREYTDPDHVDAKYNYSIIEPSDNKHKATALPDVKLKPTAPVLIDHDEIPTAPVLIDHGETTTAPPDYVDGNFRAIATELVNGKHDNTTMESSDRNNKSLVFKHESQTHQHSAGELDNTKTTSVKNADNELAVSEIGHGNYSLAVVPYIYASEPKLVDRQHHNKVEELSDEKYKPTTPLLSSGKYALNADQLVDRKFTSTPSVELEKKEYTGTNEKYKFQYDESPKQYRYSSAPETDRRSTHYPTEDNYKRRTNNDDVLSNAQSCLECCQLIAFCLMCIVEIAKCCK